MLLHNVTLHEQEGFSKFIWKWNPLILKDHFKDLTFQKTNKITRIKSEENRLLEAKPTDSQVGNLEKQPQNSSRGSQNVRHLLLAIHWLTGAITVFLRNIYWASMMLQGLWQKLKTENEQDREGPWFHKAYIPLGNKHKKISKFIRAMREGKKTNENLDDVTKRIWLRQADIKIKISKQISKMLETPTGLS